MDTYESIRSRFNSPRAAEKYSRHTLSAGRRKQREARCILKALADIPRGRRVLDLPCGTGAISNALAAAGYRVDAADSSGHMLAYARKGVPGGRAVSGSVLFSCRDILKTGYCDNEFDAVVCNRLFHHYPEARIRRMAFRELGRICRGPVVVSFFRDLTLSAVWNHHIRRRLLLKQPTDRIPITLRELCADAREAGLGAVAVYGVRPGISMQTYVKFRSFKDSPGRPPFHVQGGRREWPPYCPG